jgi:hypothetical protein
MSVTVAEVTVAEVMITHKHVPNGEPNSDPVGLIPLTGGGGDRYVLKPMCYSQVYQRSNPTVK